MTSTTPQSTDFSRDILGRFVCNGLDEAMRSADSRARSDARAFDIIIVGGGSFGGVLAQHLLYRDVAHRHRILVLEAGPFTIPEHVQNLPAVGLNVPSATTIAKLRGTGQAHLARSEVWGLPWHSDTDFPGLAYCVGGRSVYWGGWSPRLLDAEMPPSAWPPVVVAELKARYFDEASEQIGADTTNDFIDGALHRALRARIFDAIANDAISGAVPLSELVLHVKGVPAKERDLAKLDAPLAVQSRTEAGLFPVNKFSSVPLLTQAARSAWAESQNDDVKKRLMVVPNCHVTRLRAVGGRVGAVETNQGIIGVPDGGTVIVAAGTIETTRLALLSFGPAMAAATDDGGYTAWFDELGRNLMAHLRSNLTIRVPKESLGTLERSVQASALFVKGRHMRADGSAAYFHLQITAGGLGPRGIDSEASLFKKIPDIDTFESFRSANDTHVVVTIRGIGEMQAGNPANRVTLTSEPDEFGVRRAFVQISASDADRALWDAMDQAADDVARVVAGGKTMEVFTPLGAIKVAPGDALAGVLPYSARRDGLGTTHHEAGTLRIGSDPSTSVTDETCAFHRVTNCYAAGPCLFPSIGSPNPMLTGVALARRLADHLAPPPVVYQPGDGCTPLFDGFTLDTWRMAGSGKFALVDGTLESVPGNDLGLLWCTVPTPPDFVLKLEWLRWNDGDNSGVFVRFPDPTSKGYQNQAWVAVHFGFEVQIDEWARPDGLPMHRTGAVYGVPAQNTTPQPARAPGEWNDFEIRVESQTYTVLLNGAQVTSCTNADSSRGLPSSPLTPSYLGLQSYPGSRVAFRNIRIKQA